MRPLLVPYAGVAKRSFPRRSYSAVMQPDTLPTAGAYYRPTRARALRARARTQEMWGGRLLAVGLLCAGCGLVAGLLVPGLPLIGLALGVDRPHLADAPARLALSLLPAAAVLVALYLLLAVLAALLEREARALEAEHAARYGSLPDEVP